MKFSEKLTARRVPGLVILRARGLSELLTAVPAMRALSRKWPDHRRILAAPGWLAPIALLTGAVDEVADTLPLGELPRRLHGADIAVNLHGRGPQSHRTLLALRPRRFIAYAHPLVPRTASSPIWPDGQHDTLRWCRLLEENGIDADPADLQLKTSMMPAPLGTAGVTLIYPGARSQARLWPAERWAAVARYEKEAGRRVIVMGGGASQLAFSIAEAARLPQESVLAGDTSLMELVALVAVAGRVVSGDTGIAHLAIATGTPSLTLFGPTSPREWGPPPNRPWHQAIWTGRTGDPEGKEIHPGMLEISVGQVTETLDSLSGRNGRQESRAVQPDGSWKMLKYKTHETRHDAQKRARTASGPRIIINATGQTCLFE